MNSRRRIGLFLALAGVALVAALLARLPLRSASALRSSLLRETPLGTSVSEVRDFLERGGRLDHRYAGTAGFYRQEPGEPPQVIGSSSLRADLGHYYLPLRTDVTAYWGFDDQGRLIDVWVWKTVDAL